MPQIYPQRNQLKYTKKQYRVRNWKEYEAGLCKRGDLTIWLSEDALRDWHPAVGAKPGGQRRYSDTAIETALTVRAVYGLALRQTEGFLRSVARLLQLDIEIPDHSTLSRRSLTLKAPLRNTGNADSPVHTLIDSTGLKAHRGSDDPTPTRILIPPGRNAKTSDDAGVESDQRDENIRLIDRVDRRCWQRESGYTRRSLVETAVSRFKNQFGSTLGGRTMRSQVTEVRIACSILNTMTKLGMPDGHCVS